MKKIDIVIIHESPNSRNIIIKIVKENFPLFNIVGSFNINNDDLQKSLKINPDLFLISTKVDYNDNSLFFEKIKSKSDFILLIDNNSEAYIGFKINAFDVIDYPFTLEKLLFSFNKYYWRFFFKKIKVNL